MDESDFRAALPELEARLATPGVRGVYEERLPPELNAALALGCVAVVAAPAARGRNLGSGFDLSELEMRPVVQVGPRGWGWGVVAGLGWLGGWGLRGPRDWGTRSSSLEGRWRCACSGATARVKATGKTLS